MRGSECAECLWRSSLGGLNLSYIQSLSVLHHIAISYTLQQKVSTSLQRTHTLETCVLASQIQDQWNEQMKIKEKKDLNVPYLKAYASAVSSEEVISECLASLFVSSFGERACLPACVRACVFLLRCCYPMRALAFWTSFSRSLSLPRRLPHSLPPITAINREHVSFWMMQHERTIRQRDRQRERDRGIGKKQRDWRKEHRLRVKENICGGTDGKCEDK